jgi:prephenate dehydrogenase
VLHQAQRFRMSLERLEALVRSEDAATLEAVLKPISEARVAWAPAFKDAGADEPSSRY